MGIRANDPRLWWGGLSLALVAAGTILWGQYKPTVKVPHPVDWEHVASVCPDYEIEDAALERAMEALVDRELPLRLELGPCPLRAAIHLRISPADIDRIYPPDPTMDGTHARGAYERMVYKDLVVDCSAYVELPSDAEALAHEVLHCLGYDHALNAPIGHILNRDYDRVSLGDFRGIGTGR